MNLFGIEITTRKNGHVTRIECDNRHDDLRERIIEVKDTVNRRIDDLKDFITNNKGG